MMSSSYNTGSIQIIYEKYLHVIHLWNKLHVIHLWKKLHVKHLRYIYIFIQTNYAICFIFILTLSEKVNLP